MEDKYSFTEGNIVKKLIKFMLPILAALFLQAMYGAVDILIVGRFGSNEGISGVSTGSNIINLVVFTVAGLSMGLTVLIGRYIGERKNENIGKLIGGAISFFSLLSIIVAIFLIVFAKPLANIMNAPIDALDETISYVRICGGGIIFIISYNLISSIFRGLGDSKLPLLFVGIACVVNIVLDLIFVALLKMDVVGAALATVLAQAVSVILSIIILSKRKLPFTIKRSDICFNGEIKKFVKIGSPIALQEILTSISFMALCAFINDLGLDASSGYGIANKITGFIMLIPGALMQSMSSFVAQNVGANKEDRARKAMYAGMSIGALIGVFVCVISFVYGDILSSIFVTDSLVIERSQEYLKGFALEAVVTCILFSFMGYFNGHKKTMFVMIQGLAQTFLIRLPFSYIMCIKPNTNLTLIGLAAPAATIFGIIINLVYYLIYIKKEQKTDLIY